MAASNIQCPAATSACKNLRTRSWKLAHPAHKAKNTPRALRSILFDLHTHVYVLIRRGHLPTPTPTTCAHGVIMFGSRLVVCWVVRVISDELVDFVPQKRTDAACTCSSAVLRFGCEGMVPLAHYMWPVYIRR